MGTKPIDAAGQRPFCLMNGVLPDLLCVLEVVLAWLGEQIEWPSSSSIIGEEPELSHFFILAPLIVPGLPVRRLSVAFAIQQAVHLGPFE